jgi:hypothetical protein
MLVLENIFLFASILGSSEIEFKIQIGLNSIFSKSKTITDNTILALKF